MSVKLSILFLSRNDGYNGDNIGRLLLSLRSLNKALNNFINWEVILVDYNQVPGNPIDLSFDPHVRHFTILNSEHVKFVDKHFDCGSIIKLRKTNLTREQVCSLPYFPMYAANEGIKHALGEYVLITSTDNIFSCRLRSVIDDLKPGYLYRARRKITDDKTGRMNFKAICGNRFTEPNHKKIQHNNRRRNVLKASGDFMLMDKSSFMKIGGWIPLPLPLPFKPENIMMYAASLMGIPICATNYEFVNIHITAPYKKTVAFFNYIAKYNGIMYDHLAECDSAGLCRFDKWIANHKFTSSPQILSYKCSNRQSSLRRYNDIMNMFHSVIGTQGSFAVDS